ncbi:MAG: pectin acetylesterase-family hydrolase, partial [Chloroflexota bacterium]
AVAVDAAGAAYVAGCTHSADFPIANALQAAHAGVNSDAFVAKVSADGSALAYATYLGGTDEDFINGLAVDSLGRAVVVGETYSTDFPLANAVQAGHRGGLTEGFVARLDAAGSSLDFATYLGGADDDSANGVAVDTAGRVYVAGQTRSVDFPTVNAIQTTRQGTDADAFAAKFTASGTGLLYATYLGGSGRDGATSVAVNANGSAVVVGATASADFPVANPSQAAFAGGETDAFVAKLSPNGAMLQYATYLGGSQFDWATSVALDGGGQAYAAGFADSADLPTANGLQTVIGGQHDAFLVKLSHDDDGNGTADLPTLDTVTVTEQTESPLSMAGGGGDPTGLALAPQAPVAMSLYTVTDTAINQAICNDGTPAVFYYRRGDGSGTNKWQIYLEGGGFCNDVASCNARYITNRQLMTSNGAAPTRMGGGILNPDPVLNPDFHNVNTVFIHYCSSDSWGGDREASADTGNWHFRGKRIIEAVVATLQDPAKIPSPNLADATHVFFSGTSSGGVGAMSFVDWLTAELPWATVKGMNDAGWAIQVAPYNPTFRTWYETFEMGHSFWNGTVDASCAAAYPATPYYCYLGMLAVPHVSTPFFVHAAQLDQELLNTFLGLTPPYDLNEEAYALTYAGLVRDSLAPFPAVFSPRGRFHGILNTVRFFNLSAGGLTLRPMLGTWYNNTAGPIKIVEINRPPTATFANTSGVINEGQSATLTFSGVTDPDPGDTALGFRYGFDCTNDGTFELQHVPTASFACAYADSGTYTAHGRVKDDLGAARDYTIQVTVLNVAPIVAAGADRIVYRNDVVNLSGSWTDAAGALDGPFAWSWDLTGDGLADTSGTAAYGVSVPATTSFATEGFYTLEFIVTDKDGGQGKDSLVVEVLNRPPDCSAAAPSTATLWSPNHEFVPITILGVTDPEGDSITITVDSIWQDEITDGNGDGNTEVDGQGVGTSVAQVRAERAGGGDGRVYHISFTAADGHGGLCSGTVLVSVPHDQNSPGGEAVDGGALYDSTIGTP